MNQLNLTFDPTEVSETKDGGKYYGHGPVHFFTSTNNFSIEASDVQIDNLKYDKVIITNIHTKDQIEFIFTHYDKDSSGEDIYGANYRAVKGHTKPCGLLIIND